MRPGATSEDALQQARGGSEPASRRFHRFMLGVGFDRGVWGGPQIFLEEASETLGVWVKHAQSRLALRTSGRVSVLCAAASILTRCLQFQD